MRASWLIPYVTGCILLSSTKYPLNMSYFLPALPTVNNWIMSSASCTYLKKNEKKKRMKKNSLILRDSTTVHARYTQDYFNIPI